MSEPEEGVAGSIEELLQGSDPQQTAEAMRRQLAAERERLATLESVGASPLESALVSLEIATLLFEALAAFDQLVAGESWQAAVECCDILYQCDRPESIRALAHGVWLGITFSVAPDILINQLHHIVDDTPDHSDGGAVAAMAAHYIADVHAEGQERENLRFLTTEIVARVAKRHRSIESQEGLTAWISILGLDDPGNLFKSLGQMLDAMADGVWWIDRDRLRARVAPPA
jgi:hypothetical protein